jgi:hypothetical protein
MIASTHVGRHAKGLRKPPRSSEHTRANAAPEPRSVQESLSLVTLGASANPFVQDKRQCVGVTMGIELGTRLNCDEDGDAVGAFA